MATTSETHQRVMLRLRTLELMLNDLPEVAEEWEGLPDTERESWSLDWGNEMASLEGLAQLASEGQLSASQREQLRQLLRKLKEALPTIGRLHLRQPPVPLGT